MYINGIVSASSEIVATLFSGYIALKFGLIKAFVFSFSVAILGMGALILYQDHGNNQFLLSLFILGSKYGVSSSFMVAYNANV